MLLPFLAVLNLIHGVLGLLVAKLRSMPVVYNLFVDGAPDNVLQFINKAWPDSVFQPWEPNTAEPVAAPKRGYAISAAQVVVSTWYLVTSCGPRSRG